MFKAFSLTCMSMSVLWILIAPHFLEWGAEVVVMIYFAILCLGTFLLIIGITKEETNAKK